MRRVFECKISENAQVYERECAGLWVKREPDRLAGGLACPALEVDIITLFQEGLVVVKHLFIEM